MDDIAITELEKIDATRVDGVGTPANGIPILLMKAVDEPVEKDWAAWDAAHEGGGGGKAAAGGDTKASAADAVARAKQTIADHKAGKKVSAAELKNAHEVHEAHLAHEAKLKADAEAKAKGASKPAAKPAAKPGTAAAAGAAAASALTSKKEVAKGARDCPKCDKSYDADHEGGKCENCGTDLPDAPAAKAEFDRDAALEVVKAIVARKVDEAPDIAGGTAVIAQIADLIIAEAQELKAGNTGEIEDIQQLACAAQMIWSWRTGEEAVSSGSVMPATALMQSAAEDVEKGGPSAAERRQAASEGNALSDGSYPIRNEHELHAAAILARSGHGDVEGAKRLIARRAKELGVDNPLDGDEDDASKSQIAPEVTTVDTVTQETGGLTKAVEDAIAKATAPLQERIKALDAELAKVKATPVPSGLVLSRNVQVKAPGGAVNEDKAAKAALMRQKAAEATDPGDRAGYTAYARELDEEARKAAPSA